MAGDPFTSAIFGWLDRVANDTSLPHAAFRLAYIISQHINRNSHTAWPSQETVAEALGLGRSENATRTVRRLLTALITAGHLITIRRKQTSLLYRLARDRTELSYQEEQSASDSDLGPDKIVRSNAKTGHFSTPRPDISQPQDRTELSAKPLKEPLKNHEGENRARATFLPNDFRLDDQSHNLALQQLGSNEAVERSVRRFIDHHRQVDGPKAKSRDWQATARLWIDTDAQRTKSKSGSVVDAADRLVDRIKSFDAGAAPSENEWDGVLKLYAKTGHWTRHVDQFGGEPGSLSCKAPPALLAKHGLPREAAA